MQNSEYWKLRFEQLEQAQNQLGVQCYVEIEQQYKRAQKQLEEKILVWYQRIAKNNGVTMAEARKLLTSAELKEFKWDVHDYIKHGEENAINEQWIKQLENASAKYHISRLEALKIQVQQNIEALYGNQLNSIESAMKNIYKSGYYHNAFEIQKGIGVGWNFALLDKRTISKVINKPWAVDGKNFSERIWGNKQKLINEVYNEISQNILLGADPQKAIDAIAKKMNTSKNNAGRLVMTEEAYFSSAAQKDCFEELGVEQYEIVATLDSHTSDICRRLDGKHFPMKDYQPGVTAPPFHVYCRSTTVPYFDEDFGDIGERAARDKDGNTYYVPANMNYKQWEESFVDNFGRSDIKSSALNPYSKTAEKSNKHDVLPKVKKPVSTHDSVTDKKFYKSEDFVINPKLKTDVKNGFLDAANKVYEQFGREIAIDKIDVVKSGNTKYMQASYNPLTKTIKLVNSSMSTYEKKACKSFADNWNSSKDKYGTFYHEIGHAVWEDLSSEAKSQISAIYEATKHEAYLKWMEAGGSSSGLSQADYFEKALSRYGATNKNEFFSEAFAQVMSRRMKPVSRQINQILQEQYASVQLNKNALDKFVQDGIIKTDEIIGKSVGASAKNYPVRLPNGNHAKFAEGSTISKIKVFAGNGTDVSIRNAIYLESDYGISADKWQKVRGEGIIVENGKQRQAELHWYEAEGQKYDIKVKRYLDEG